MSRDVSVGRRGPPGRGGAEVEECVRHPSRPDSAPPVDGGGEKEPRGDREAEAGAELLFARKGALKWFLKQRTDWIAASRISGMNRRK